MNITQCSLAIIIMIYGFLQSPIAYCNESSNKLYQPFLLGMVSGMVGVCAVKYRQAIYKAQDARDRELTFSELKKFFIKKGMENLKVGISFVDIKSTSKIGKTMARTNGKIIEFDMAVLERLTEFTRAGKTFHPADKRVILHELAHIYHADVAEASIWNKVLDQGDYFKGEILDVFTDAPKEKDCLLKYIDRAQEFYADVYALEQFSNAELYDYIRYSTSCSRSPLECHLNSFQFGKLAQEILTERETGIKKPSAVAAEFFKESLANISSYELPLYLSGLLL